MPAESLVSYIDMLIPSNVPESGVSVLNGALSVVGAGVAGVEPSSGTAILLLRRLSGGL